MKLNARDAAAFFARPDPSKAGILIYGQDAMRVALKRQQMVGALLGPNADEEMRLSRMTGADLRKDGALLSDAVKAVGFFPGHRIALVEDATDGLDDVLGTALDTWQPGDAQVVVTAGQLKARAKLRKRFESAPGLIAIGIYDDPPSRAEIDAMLADGGLRDLSGDATAALTALSRALDPGDFRQTVEKISLYKLNDASPLSVDEIEALTPATLDAGLDDLLTVTADGEAARIGPLLRRLQAQGVSPVALVIAATRYFRQLHAAAADPGGPGAGVGKLRPPVYGPRRDRMLRQASAWGMYKLEKGLAVLMDTDLTLRSAKQVPHMAVVERALLRLAWMNRR